MTCPGTSRTDAPTDFSAQRSAASTPSPQPSAQLRRAPVASSCDRQTRLSAPTRVPRRRDRGAARSWQTGSVAAASPVSAAPGSGSRRSPPPGGPSGQLRQGSCIQSVPRKRIERLRLEPDLRQRVLADVLELEARDRRRRLAGQHVAVRRDHDRVVTPAAHAWLRQLLVVVGQHPEDVDLRAEALAEAADRFLAAARAAPVLAAAPPGLRPPSRSTAC